MNKSNNFMKQRIYRFVLLASILGLPTHARAQDDHLRPDEGYLSSAGFAHVYLVAVRDTLVRNATDSPATMVTLPSFQPESIVFLLEKDETVFVVSAITTKQIWSSDNRRDIKVNTKEKPINAAIAEQISAAFALATSQAHYPKERRMGNDGVTYHFSSFVRGTGVMAGQTWSPDPHTTCGMLVTLGEDMHGYVRGEIDAEKLASEARDILRILKKID